MSKLDSESRDVFTGIGYFKGTFFLPIKDNPKPYQVPLRFIVDALQE